MIIVSALTLMLFCWLLGIVAPRFSKPRATE